MIKCDTSKLQEQLKKFHSDAIKRMEQMVSKFAYWVTVSAVNYTPIGNSERFAALYKLRETYYHLQPVEGFAKGSWQISLDGTLDMQELYGVTSGDTAKDASITQMMNYRLGEEVLIGNLGPYIEKLENNHSVQTNDNGIMRPTLDVITGIYQFNLADYYKANRAT